MNLSSLNEIRGLVTTITHYKDEHLIHLKTMDIQLVDWCHHHNISFPLHL